MLDLNVLDIILEDYPPDAASHPYTSANELVSQLRDARQQVLDIEHRLSSIKNRMSSDLALSIRKLQPGLNVAVDKNGCKVGYKTKILTFNPDVESGMWRAISPNRRFLREFLNSHRRATLMVSDTSILASSIVSYFSTYYRTLHEDITGTGVLLVEDKRASLTELVHWGKPLKPRLVRGTRDG